MSDKNQKGALANQNGTLTFTAEEFEKDPDFIANLLSRIGFFPYNATFHVELEIFIMVGFSRRFRPLKVGEEAPAYKLMVSDNDVEGEIKVIDIKYLSIPAKGESKEHFHERAKRKIIDTKLGKVFEELDTNISH